LIDRALTHSILYNNPMALSYLAFVALGIIWGTNFLFMKIAVGTLHPLQIAWCRVFFGAIPILIAALLRRALHWRDLRRIHHYLALALLANVLPFYLLVKGTEHLKSGIAGVMAGAVPLVTVAIAAIFLPSEKIGPRKAMGLGLGFCGVALVAQVPKFLSTGISGELYGVGFMMLAAVCFASTMVYTKKWLNPLKLTPLQLAAYQTLIATIILSFLTPLKGIENVLSNPKIFWTAVIGLGLFGTGISYILFYYIIEKLGPVTASSVYYIPPLVALVMGSFFVNETISLAQGMGSFLILVGVYFARSVRRAQSG
jgi:drug/metabolite transporter (DMT)-like permease